MQLPVHKASKTKRVLLPHTQSKKPAGAFTHLDAGGWKTGTAADLNRGKDPDISKDIIDRGMTGSITI